MSTKHLLLELEKLDHQAGQRLVGGWLSLDVLGGRRENQSHISRLVCVERKLWRVCCRFELLAKFVNSTCIYIYKRLLNSCFCFKVKNECIILVGSVFYEASIPLSGSRRAMALRQRGAPASTSGSELADRLTC